MKIQEKIRTNGFSDDLFRIKFVALANQNRVLGWQEFFLGRRVGVRWVAKGIEIPTSFTLFLNAEGEDVSFLYIDW